MSEAAERPFIAPMMVTEPGTEEPIHAYGVIDGETVTACGRACSKWPLILAFEPTCKACIAAIVDPVEKANQLLTENAALREALRELPAIVSELTQATEEYTSEIGSGYSSEDQDKAENRRNDASRKLLAWYKKVGVDNG